MCLVLLTAQADSFPQLQSAASSLVQSVTDSHRLQVSGSKHIIHALSSHSRLSPAEPASAQGRPSWTRPAASTACSARPTCPRWA